MEPDPVRFDALDGVPLAGSLFAPDAPRAALVVNSGTGIPRRFYGRFAAHAARRGFAVLTYDYRGIGDSAPVSLRGYDARFRDWGQRDIPGALGWLSARHPDLPLFVVGHSAGGQQLGLAPNADLVRTAVFVAVSTGYWRGMSPLYAAFTLALWRAYLPAASRLFGYAPARLIGWGEDLPAGVAREWGAWCQDPAYLAAFFDDDAAPPDGTPFGPTHYDAVRCPIRAYYFPDDPITARPNIAPLLGLYTNASVEQRWVEPAELGAGEIGHLGFFRSDLGEPLWDEALDWLLAAGAAA